jgi:hypothetical protein
MMMANVIETEDGLENEHAVHRDASLNSVGSGFIGRDRGGGGSHSRLQIKDGLAGKRRKYGIKKKLSVQEIQIPTEREGIR